MNDIEKQIQTLQKQADALKLEESKKAWLDWHIETKKFLDSIIGRTFISRGNDNFIIFKVISYNKSNWLGNHDWKGFYDIKTEGYFNINSSKYNFSSRFNIPSGEGYPFGTFSVMTNNTKKKSKTLSQITYNGQSADEHCGLDISKKFHINYRGEDWEDTKYAFTEKPEQSAKSWLCGIWGWYNAPEGLYDKCKALADNIAKETDIIWQEYQDKIELCKRI